MPSHDVVGTPDNADRASIRDLWDQLYKWALAARQKLQPTYPSHGPMHVVVDDVRWLEANVPGNKVPAGSGDLAEELWQTMVAGQEEDQGAATAADFVAKARSLIANKV